MILKRRKQHRLGRRLSGNRQIKSTSLAFPGRLTLFRITSRYNLCIWLGIPGIGIFYPLKFGSARKKRWEINADGLGSGLAVMWALIALCTSITVGWACVFWLASW